MIEYTLTVCLRVWWDISATIAQQGQTLPVAIVDCLEAAHVSKMADMVAAYMSLSRVKTKEA